MTRKGARQIGWTTADERFLVDHAGILTRREICKELKRSAESVRSRARRLGVSLRCYESRLEWCAECATWRSTVSPKTGRCAVCRKRDQLDASERRIADALEHLPSEARAVYEGSESSRGTRKPPTRPKRPRRTGNRYADAKADDAHLIAVETWEAALLDLKIDANKTRLKRIRAKVGANPRKKIE